MSGKVEWLYLGLDRHLLDCELKNIQFHLKSRKDGRDKICGHHMIRPLDTTQVLSEKYITANSFRENCVVSFIRGTVYLEERARGRTYALVMNDEGPTVFPRRNYLDVACNARGPCADRLFRGKCNFWYSRVTRDFTFVLPSFNRGCSPCFPKHRFLLLPFTPRGASLA